MKQISNRDIFVVQHSKLQESVYDTETEDNTRV